MNAFSKVPPRRLNEAELDSLVDAYLLREAQRDAAFRDHRQTTLERFLERLGRAHRRALTRSLFGSLRVPGWASLRRRQGRVRETSDGTPVNKGQIVALPTAVPRHLIRAGVVAALVATTMLGLEPLARPVLQGLGSEEAHRALVAVRCGQATMLRDEAAALVGAHRMGGGGSCDDVHLSAPFDRDTARQIAEAVGVLEGRWKRGPLTLFGQDIVGFARAMVSSIELGLRGIDRMEALVSRNSGRPLTWIPIAGSPPMLSAFEALIGQPNAVSGVMTKARHIWSAMLFDAQHLGEDTARAHFLAQQMTVIRVQGRALAGALAAEVLFGGPPRNLGQVCLFAAASGFHLYSPYEGASERWMALSEQRLARAKGRAKACVDALAAGNELVDARAEIDRFVLPQPGLPPLPAAVTLTVADALGMRAISARPPEAVLTLNLAAQRASAAPVEEILAGIGSRLPERLCFAGDCDVRADYLVAIAEVAGDTLPLRAVFTNRHRMLFGPYQRQDDGTVVALTPAFGLGSQHKVLLALIAARHGETRLCNRRVAAIRNTSGPAPVDGCASGDGWIPIHEAMGRSMNLPWIDLAARHSAEVDVLELALGFRGTPTGPAAAALGVGRVAPPERFIALMAALERAHRGEPPRTDGLSLLVGSPSFGIDLEALGYSRDAAGRAASHLVASISEPHGTLRNLRRQLAGTGCVPRLGKTGTGETTTGEARSRTATVAVACGGRRYVAFAAIDSGHGRTPIGSITARDVGALIVAALSGVLPDGQP